MTSPSLCFRAHAELKNQIEAGGSKTGFNLYLLYQAAGWPAGLSPREWLVLAQPAVAALETYWRSLESSVGFCAPPEAFPHGDQGEVDWMPICHSMPIAMLYAQALDDTTRGKDVSPPPLFPPRLAIVDE